MVRNKYGPQLKLNYRLPDTPEKEQRVTLRLNFVNRPVSAGQILFGQVEPVNES